MSLIKWEPFAQMNTFFDDDFFNVPSWTKLGGDGAIDVYEEGKNVIAEVNLPGFNHKNVDITIDEDILRIKAERSETSERTNKNYFTKEIKRGSFERTLRLPYAVDAQASIAEKKDGVLRITMPKISKEKHGGTKVKIA